MANIYDKKEEEQFEKNRKKHKMHEIKYDIENKIIDTINPLRIIAGMADVTEKAFDTVGNAIDYTFKRIVISDKDLEQIKKEYNGSNLRELSKKYGYSERLIKKELGL